MRSRLSDASPHFLPHPDHRPPGADLMATEERYNEALDDLARARVIIDDLCRHLAAAGWHGSRAAVLAGLDEVAARREAEDFVVHLREEWGRD